MKKLCISLSLLLLSFFTAFAQRNRLDSIFRSMPAGKRPKIAAVMSEGRAKGIAHIGALKYLEEFGILVDIAALNDSGYVAVTRSKAQLEDLLENLSGRPDFDKKYSNAARSLYATRAGSLEEDSVSSAGISFQRINAYNANWLINKAKLTENMKCSGKDVEAAIDVIHRTGTYKSIRYYLRGTQEPYNLLTDIEPGKLCQFNFDTVETAAMLLNVSLDKLKLYGPKLDMGY